MNLHGATGMDNPLSLNWPSDFDGVHQRPDNPYLNPPQSAAEALRRQQDRVPRDIKATPQPSINLLDKRGNDYMQDKTAVPALSTQVGGSHYKDMPIQPIEFCHQNRLMACETLAIKYLCRHGMKHGKEDLLKAIHCIQLLIEMEYPEQL